MNDDLVAPPKTPDFADARLFVGRAYRGLLGRSADPVGLTSYAGLLTNGNMSQAEVIGRLLDSDEFAARWLTGLPDAAETLAPAEEIVSRVYQAILRRRPEAEAFAMYVDALATGKMTEADLVRELLSSEEFRRIGETERAGAPAVPAGPGMSEADAAIVVSQAYAIYLDREPDPSGLEGHKARLVAGRVSIERLNEEFAFSPERLAVQQAKKLAPRPPVVAHEATGRPLGMSEADAGFVVSHAYATYLGRQPDPAGFEAHVARLCGGAVPVEQLFLEFQHSPELLIRSQQKSESDGLDAAAVMLSPTYGIAHQKWEEYLATLFGVAREDGGGRPLPAIHRLHLVVEWDGVAETDWLDSVRSLAELAAGADVTLSMSLLTAGEPARDDGDAAKNRVGLPRVAVLSGPPAPEELRDDDLVFWVQAGDRLCPDFLDLLIRRIGQDTSLVTTDGFFVEEGEIFPVLHPGANVTLALNCEFAFSRVGCRAALLRTGVAKADMRGADLLRQWVRSQDGAAGWTHVALPVINQRMTRNDVVDVQRRSAVEGKPFESISLTNEPPPGHVTVVICTKDKGKLLDQLVTGLLSKYDHLLADVIIVSNNTSSFLAEQTFEKLKAISPRVKIVRYDSAFNFSAQSNLGARLGSGSYILMLNDDIVPIADGWIEHLLAPFRDPDVAIVGPLLLYPDERVQHAGMYIGFSGSAGHAMRFARIPDEDYLFMANVPRDTSVVTGAVMMMSRTIFDALNGFDELLASYLQDVDICMRAYNAGYRIVFNPMAQLFHMESASVHELISDARVQENRGREHAYFAKRWARSLNHDDYHNPLFDPADESMRSLRVSRLQV